MYRSSSSRFSYRINECHQMAINMPGEGVDKEKIPHEKRCCRYPHPKVWANNLTQILITDLIVKIHILRACSASSVDSA
jgi:hypothetical protein